MQTLIRLPRIASIVAFVLAGLVILGGLLGPILLLPLALIPLAAGIGILRRRVWSAYGFATISFAQILLLPLILSRSGYPAGYALRAILSSLFSLVLGILFWSAGRSLAASGAASGWAFPWITGAALSVAPFFFIQPFEIPAGSMEPTLLTGDRILAQTFPLRLPERGNVVLFLSPQDRGRILVKRVIAVPGDHIRISRKVVLLNGIALDENYAMHKAGEEDFYPDEFPNDSILEGCAEGHEALSQHTVKGEIVVPAGQYFVLGDNRENSLDSRCWGFVSASDLKGKPLMIYDSIEKTVEPDEDPNQDWLGHRRWPRLFKAL